MDYKKFTTFVIPTYNRPQKLERCLNSISRQTCQDFNIIVVNDNGCNVDNVCKVPNLDIKIINLDKNNGYPAPVYNVGFKLVTTPYVNMLADDDTIEENHVEVLKKYVTNIDRNDMIVHTKCFLVREFEDGHAYEKIGDNSSIDRFDSPSVNRLMYDCDIAGMCVAIPMEAINKLGGFDENMDTKEDWELWLRFAKNGYKFFSIGTTTASWHLHGNNLTFSAGVERNIKAVKYLFNKYPSRNENVNKTRNEVIKNYGG